MRALTERAGAIAERGAGQAAERIAERLEAEMPSGMRIERGDGGIVLSGRGLKARMALDPALRDAMARLA